MKEFDIASGWYWLLIGALASYLIGCFHFAKIIVKLRHADLGKDGNPGAMNVSRKLGLKFGLLNFFCDALKGVVPVLVAYFVFRNYNFKGTNVCVADFCRYFYALFAVIGHIFPVFHKFKGGKGISTTIGLLLASIACDTWWFALLGLVLFFLLFVFVFFTEWGGMGSLLGVAGFTVWQAVIFIVRYTELQAMNNVYVILTLMMLLALNILTWGAHNRNIYRMLEGEEHRTSLKKMLKRKQKKSQ